MTTAIIIEDERASSELLLSILKTEAPDIKIQATISTVKDGIEYLTNNKVDLIFCDVQLSDGLSFLIFNKLNISTPVIFITGYDKFVMNAFAHNGIDYLLKPVSQDDLKKALNKYNKLKNHFTLKNADIDKILHFFDAKKKTRLIVKRGIESVALPIEDISLFYTENKVVYVLDKSGKKYLIDRNLADLEEELDKEMFFRVNRQFIVNLNFIKGFKPFERVKLLVDLTLENFNHPIIVSQETAPLFKKWISGN